MDADWYVDPLGRYDGRFFDGTMWTERVSDGGVPAVDADWPPAQVAAVQPVARPATLRASMLQESPVRIVAVLDEPLRATAPAQHGRRVVLVAVGVALIIALAVLWVKRGGDPSEAGLTDQVSSDQAQSGSVDVADPSDLDDLEAIEVGDGGEAGTGGAGGATDRGARIGLVDPDPSYGPKDLIEVGTLRVVNGAAVLRELARWHREQAIARGLEPGDASGCWFGRLAGAAVQSVACGPTPGAAGELRYDLVPVRFVDDARGQLARPVIEAVTFDAVLANGLELIGGADGPEPPG